MITKLNQLWWQTIPVAVSRFSKLFGVIAADGIYLVSFKRFAALSPLLALVLGAVCGGLQFGAETVFSESLLLIIITLLVGCVSTLHGGLFVTGFAAVNFFVARQGYLSSDIDDQVKFHLALLITYAAMALLAVGIPFLTKAFRSTVQFNLVPGADARLIVQAIFGGALYGGLTFLYLQVLPLLIRPPFTWLETTPTVEAAYQAQHFTEVIVICAVVAGAVRVIAEAVSAAFDPIGQSIALEPVQKALENKGLLDRLPLFIQMLVSTVATTILFAGLLMSWIDAAIIAGGFLAVNLGRRTVAKAVPIWPEIMNRVPILIRIAVALGVIYALSSPYMNQFFGGSSFTSLIGGALGGMVVMAIFLPPRPKQTVNVEPKQDEEDIL